MNSASNGGRRRAAGLDPVPTLLAKYIVAIVGAVASIAAFVTVVTAKSARTFVDQHAFLVYVALVITALTLAATLNYVRLLRQVNARLARAAEKPPSSPPTPHDLSYFAEVLTDLPVHGPVIAWLKQAKIAALTADQIPADVLSALQNTAERPRLRAVGFDDPATATAFNAFTQAILEFCAAADQWTLAHLTAKLIGGPREHAGTVIDDQTTADQPDEAGDALSDCHRRLVQAYDAFMVTAHQRGIDAAAPG